MNRISILNVYSDINLRGSEFWSKSLKKELNKSFEVNIFSKIFNDFSRWIKGDVIIPTNGRSQVFFCRLLTWIYRKPMIVFGHSGPGADDKWNLLCSPDVFVAFSTHQKEWAERFKLPWTKIVLIPHAIDLGRFTPARVKPNKKIILCVAANDPNKRVNLVEKAVGLIPQAKFIAVGKGNPIEASFEEMPGIYKSADVFCFVPQPWEAFGLVFLEAMASNLPIVTINDPVRREIVGNAGVFVDDPENVQGLAVAIEKALRTNWKNVPRKQAENFSWDKIRIKYKELFRSLRLKNELI